MDMPSNLQLPAIVSDAPLSFSAFPERVAGVGGLGEQPGERLTSLVQEYKRSTKQTRLLRVPSGLEWSD
jgi:hypothetical protein